MELNITQEQLVEIAANKLVEQVDEDSVYSRAMEIVESRITSLIEKKLTPAVDQFLRDELEKIADAEFERVTEWGEPTGQKISIRKILQEQSKHYWSQKVNNDGKSGDGYGYREERAKWFAEQVMKSTFEQAIQTNAKIVVDEFAKQLQQAGVNLVHENIGRLFKK